MKTVTLWMVDVIQCDESLRYFSYNMIVLLTFRVAVFKTEESSFTN